MPRMNLLLRTLFIGVIPILLLTVTHLVISGRSNSFYLSQVMQDGAKQVAISIGSTVNRETFSALNNQLNALTQQPSIAFIYVQTVVTEDFQVNRKLSDQFDLTVIKALHGYANQLSNQSFLWSDDASGYQELLAFKKNAFGGEIPRGIKINLEHRIDQSANRKGNLYQVSQIGVYESSYGRTFGLANREKAQILITIGMLANQNVSIVNTQNRNLLLYGAVFALFSIIVSIFFTRSISIPILKLIKAANEMSLGQLKQEIKYSSNDEIGELARALERLRISLNILLKHN